MALKKGLPYFLRPDSYSDRAGLKYTGQTSNIEERLEQHNSGSLSKFTKNKGPWRLIMLESFENRSEAVLREKYLKTGAGRDFIKKTTGY